MELIDIMNNLIKFFYISILTYFVSLKIIGSKQNSKTQILIIFLYSIINAFIYITLRNYLNGALSIIIIYLVYGFVFSILTKNRVFYSEFVIFFAFLIIELFFGISIVIVGIILRVTESSLDYKNIMYLILTVIIEISILFFILNRKRIKNGFSFLSNKEKINNIGVFGIALIGIAILIYWIIGTYNNHAINRYLVIAIIIEAICMTIWIRRKITKFYKQKLKEQTVEELTNEIKEKDELINKISEENKALATINHKYSSRIKALENFTSRIAVKPELVEKFSTEFGIDFSAINEQISNLSKEYSEEVNKRIRHDNILPKTEIFGIDNLIEYMNSEAIKNSIDLNLKINGSISEMIENVIPQNKLETLLGDHIKDAIIAINSSEENDKEILVEIGKNRDNYEVCIYDTGIEFEIDTLLKLGLEQVTTHELTGGSGIGFMTTFETLKECKASLVI